MSHRLQCKALFLILLTILSINLAFTNTINRKNIWTNISIGGDLPFKHNFFYIISGQLRLNTISPYFRQNLNTVWIGQEMNKEMSYLVGYNYVPARRRTGIVYEQRLQQQLNYGTQLTKNIELFMYNRVENRWQNKRSGIAFRDRFRLVLEGCLGDSGNCIYVANEVFINVNRVSWDNSKTYGQNRFLVGFDKQVTKKINIRIGYLNQYLRLNAPNNRAFHVLDSQLTYIVDPD